MGSISNQAARVGRSLVATDLLKDLGDIVDQPLQRRVLIGLTGENTHQSRRDQTALTETNSFTKAALDPIPPGCGPDRFPDKDTIPELLGRLPHKGKEVGRIALPLIEK
jgi:hypothetical protein